MKIDPAQARLLWPPQTSASDLHNGTSLTHRLNDAVSFRAIAAGQRLADANQMTLPPTRSLVLLAFVIAIMALLAGHPVIAAAVVGVGLLLAGFAAVLHEAPMMAAAISSRHLQLSRSVGAGARRRGRRPAGKEAVITWLVLRWLRRR